MVPIILQVPYRLHSILVHEGQAHGGHYWAYIYSPQRNKWTKYNDIAVGDISFETLYKESAGGYRFVNAYSLVYVDATHTDLFDISQDPLQLISIALKENLLKDNLVLEQELLDWKARERKVEGGLTWDYSLTCGPEFCGFLLLSFNSRINSAWRFVYCCCILLPLLD